MQNKAPTVKLRLLYIVLKGWKTAPKLLPLDGCGWLGGDVVADAVDATDLVDDLVRDLRHEIVG